MAEFGIEQRGNLRSGLGRAQRRTWIIMAVVALALITPVAALNYFVDNHNLLRDQLSSQELQDYVDSMRRAPVGVPYTFNDRSVKLLLAKESEAQCLAMGSSHIMTLRAANSAFLQDICPTLDNVGVTGASFEDVITFLGVSLQKPNVKTVVVAVSLWTFKRNTRLNWKRNNREFFDARKVFDLSPEPYREVAAAASENWIEQLLSLKYFEINYKFVKRYLAGKTTLDYDERSLTEDDLRDTMALRSDASLSYPSEFLPSPDIDESDTTDQWIEMPYVDRSVVQELKSALSVLKQRGIQPLLIEVPYHPYVVEKCPKPNICGAIPVVSAELRSIAQELEIPLVGSYLPGTLGFVADDFIDFQHIRGESWKKMR